MIDIKTIGQLIDELVIANLKVWHLIDKVMMDTATPDEAKAVQRYNMQRNELVRAIDRRLGERDIGGKVYG